MKLRLMILLCIVLVSGATTFANSTSQMEQEIMAVLGERHPQANAAWWRSLGPDAPNVIISIFSNTKNVYYKIRLIQALGWLDLSADQVDFLKGEAQNNPNRLVREAAVRSIGHSQGLKEKAFLEKAQQDKNSRVRAAATESLKNLEQSQDGELKSEEKPSTSNSGNSGDSVNYGNSGISGKRVNRIKSKRQ